MSSWRDGPRESSDDQEVEGHEVVRHSDRDQPAVPGYREVFVPQISWGSPIQAADAQPPRIWYTVLKTLFQFNLNDDSAHLLISEPIGGLPAQLPAPTPWYRPDTASARSADKQTAVPVGDYAVIDDWLWIGSGVKPWGRLSLTTGQRQQFPMLREAGNDFRPMFLQPLAEGPKLLVGDGYGLWVLTLAPGK